MTIQDYLNLITSEHRKQPNFTAMVSFGVAPLVQLQANALAMIALFDLSTPPVGQQLDFIGAWVGASRNVFIPATGIYFSWNDTTYDGWSFGSWSPTGNPTTITTLPDDAYLTFIKLTIAANYWKGTIDDAYIIWDTAIPQWGLLIVDHQDMSYAIALVGSPVDTLTLALLTEGYVKLRPEGVKITEYFVPVDNNPAFGWNIETQFVQGWNQGSWMRELPAS